MCLRSQDMMVNKIGTEELGESSFFFVSFFSPLHGAYVVTRRSVFSSW